MKHLNRLKFGALIFAITVLFSCTSDAAIYIDGKSWKNWSSSDKLIYVIGYYAGAGIGAGKLFVHVGSRGISDFYKKFSFDDMHNFTKKNIESYDIEQIVAGVDSCFSDFKNIHLPVQICIEFAEMNIDGKSPKDINIFIEDFRSKYKK
jgi:hypothetical protein